MMLTDTPPRWNRLAVSGHQLLLYRIDVDQEGFYSLFVTNMVDIWMEERVISLVSFHWLFRVLAYK